MGPEKAIPWYLWSRLVSAASAWVWLDTSLHWPPLLAGDKHSIWPSWTDLTGQASGSWGPTCPCSLCNFVGLLSFTFRYLCSWGWPLLCTPPEPHFPSCPDFGLRPWCWLEGKSRSGCFSPHPHSYCSSWERRVRSHCPLPSGPSPPHACCQQGDVPLWGQPGLRWAWYPRR